MQNGSAGSCRLPHCPGWCRCGVSVLEIMGCIVAIIVGVWAGAAYMGVDLMGLFRMGMEEAGVASPAEDPAGTPASGEGEESKPKSAEGAEESTDTADATKTATPGEATLKYWNRLREIIREEQQIRAEGERQAGSNARAALHAHSEAYVLAAQNVRQLRTKSVDGEAIMLAGEIAAWYDRGAELADEGASLLDEGELSSAQGPLGRRWHSARKQHREELDLLSRKCSSVRGKLTARYRLHFAELQ